MKTYTLRQINRDEGKAVALEIAAKRPVRIDTRAYIVPESWISIETDESPMLCNDVGSGLMQVRTSGDIPIPLRFGVSKVTQAWLVSLLRWRTMDKPEAI